MKAHRCIIRADRPKKIHAHHCTLHLEEELFRRIEDIWMKANKSRNAVMTELLEYAMLHCIIEPEAGR